MQLYFYMENTILLIRILFILFVHFQKPITRWTIHFGMMRAQLVSVIQCFFHQNIKDIFEIQLQQLTNFKTLTRYCCTFLMIPGEPGARSSKLMNGYSLSDKVFVIGFFLNWNVFVWALSIQSDKESCSCGWVWLYLLLGR